jgi:hypothetical protein
MVPRKRGDDSRRVLPWALLLSLLAHAVAIPLLMWIILLQYMAPAMMRPPHDLLIQSSTAVKIAEKSRPVPHPPKPLRLVHPEQVVAPATAAPPPPHELAQIQRSAVGESPPQPHKASFGDQLAAQNRQFAREAQRLHFENNPLSVATNAPNPTTFRRSYFDDPSNQKRVQGFMAYLSSTKQWYDGNLSCHYAAYSTQFNGGGNEDGIIPWPVCYPRDHDLLSIRSYANIVLPVPLP